MLEFISQGFCRNLQFVSTCILRDARGSKKDSLQKKFVRAGGFRRLIAFLGKVSLRDCMYGLWMPETAKKPSAGDAGHSPSVPMREL